MRYLTTTRRALFFGVILALLLVGLLFLANTFVRPHVFPSPARWDRSEYQATPNVLCPGQTFTYTPTFSVDVRPNETVIVERGAAWKLERTGMLAVTRAGTTVTVPSVSTPFDHSTSFTRTVTVTVPDFVPDVYGYYGWADVRDRDDYNPVYKVLITIPERCGTGGGYGPSRLSAGVSGVLGAGHLDLGAGAVMNPIRSHIYAALPALASLAAMVAAVVLREQGALEAMTPHLVLFVLVVAALFGLCSVDDREMAQKERRMAEQVLSACVWLEARVPALGGVWAVVWRWAWRRAEGRR